MPKIRTVITATQQANSTPRTKTTGSSFCPGIRKNIKRNKNIEGNTQTFFMFMYFSDYVEKY